MVCGTLSKYAMPSPVTVRKKDDHNSPITPLAQSVFTFTESRSLKLVSRPRNARIYRQAVTDTTLKSYYKATQTLYGNENQEKRYHQEISTGSNNVESPRKPHGSSTDIRCRLGPDVE